MITTVSLVTVHHRGSLLQCDRLDSLYCVLPTCDFLYNWKFVLLDPLCLFLSSSTPSPLVTMFLYLWLCFSFILFVLFYWSHIQLYVTEIIQYPSFSDWFHLAQYSQGPSGCCKWQEFILFYGPIISHCTDTPQLLYLLICWWAPRLLLCLHYCEHRGAYIFSN